MEKIVLGLIEIVTFIGENGKKVEAKIDTGADGSSIDLSLASDLKLGPIMDYKNYKSASGETKRPIFEVDFILKGKKMRSKFNIIDRSHMKYKVLIGKNILKQGFMIDTLK